MAAAAGVRIFALALMSACMALAAAHAGEAPPAQAAAAIAAREAAHLTGIRQLTFSGMKNGEAYFSPDGKAIVFQGVRQADNPFYQIHCLDFASGEVLRVSPGTGRTTCAYYHPSGKRLLFASSHLDPGSAAKQKEELEKQKSGPPKRYSWDFDPHFDIFEAELDGGNLRRLTDAAGYDAEGSYSPDGKRIVFCSMRDGDGEIYIMDAGGGKQTRLTQAKGYDGGPFFSPDGKQIVWRHFEDEAQKIAEVWLMDAGGGNPRQVTALKAVSWAPFFHPGMQWIVFASNFEDPAFDLYAIRPDGSQLTRLTYAPGFDGLPAFSPDGRTLLWTSNRGENKSQLFCAQFALPGEAAAPPYDARKDAGRGLSEDRIRVSDALLKAGAAGNLEHEVAHEFHAARLLPNGRLEKQDENAFIYGPRVAGWLPPGKKSGKVILAFSVLQPDEPACDGTAALAGAASSARADTKLHKDDASGLCAAAVNADDLGSVLDATRRDLERHAGAALPKPQIAAGVSLAGLAHIQSGQLVLRGAGSSPGWRELAERIAAQHPLVQVLVEDDPAGAPELAQFVSQKIPCLALTGTGEGEPLSGEPPASRRLLAEAARTAAMHCVPLLASGRIQLEFTPYDAAAAKAAAHATARPYLGTIPEYQAQGVTGVKLGGVREGSPAQKSGLQAGDVIVELGGKAVKDVNGYLEALETLKIGVETTVGIERGGQRENLKITPAAR